MDNIMEILDKLQFFGGQRAGRELWADKPTDVQDADIESFNRSIKAIRDYIQQLEAERDAAFADISKGCFSCKHGVKELFEEPCNSCRRAGGDTELWQWRGVRKEE